MSSTPPDLNLGPLTTIFTAPPECNSLTVSVAGSTYAPYVYPRLFSSIANSCFPSAFPLGAAASSSVYGPYGDHDEHVYYSPGICPSGWLQNSVGTTGAETTAFCCQPGFNPKTTPAVHGGASSTYCTSTIISTIVTTVAYTGDGEKTGFTQTFTFKDKEIPAGALWIRYKEGDFPSTSSSSLQTKTADSTKPSTSSVPTSSVPTSSAPTSSAPTSNVTAAPDSSSGLPVGAKIALGVGIPLVVILAGIISFFLFIRKRKQRQRQGHPFESATAIEENKTPREERPKSELPNSELRPMSELEGREGVARPAAYELPGSLTIPD